MNEMQVPEEQKVSLYKSKIARKLVGKSILLVTVPVIVTVLTFGYLTRDQIVWTVRTMENIQAKSAEEGRSEYQHLGTRALEQSSQQTQATSMKALKSVSRKMAAIQDSALSSTARNFSELTSNSFEDAMRQSAETNNRALTDVRDEMTQLFARTARDNQKRGADGIEAAMLAQVDTLMQERAEAVAHTINGHIEDARSYLRLTAQMPEMRDGNAAGQKTILDALVRRFPELNLVTVQDKSGQETAMSAADQAVTPSDLGKHPAAAYFKLAMRGMDYLRDDELPKTNDAPTLQIAVPIEAYQGKVVGVLAAHYSLGELWEMIRNSRIGQQGFIYVQDASAHPLLPPRPVAGTLLTSGSSIEQLNWHVVVALPRSEAMQPIQKLKSDLSHSAQNAQYAMRSKIQAASREAASRLQSDAAHLRLVTAKRVQERSVQVLQNVRETTAKQTQEEIISLQQAIQAQTTQAQRESNRHMERASDSTTQQLTQRVRPLTQQALQRANANLLMLSLLIMGASIVVGSVMAFITAARIVRPVVKLAQMTHAIAEGDLEKRVDEGAPDEIGELATAFNTMTASLQQSRSELQEAEGQLVQSAKLASLGELSAGVAHELNQPVAIIRGIIQQLQDEPGLSEDMKADLVLVEGQTGRMIKIIKHMRTFCRSGGAEFTEIEVNKIVQDCFLLIGEQLRTHNVSVVFELCGASPIVLGDTNELEQVILNLVTNARDALEGIPDARITLRSRVEGENYLLEVRDNGTGVPDEILTRIFDPFYTTKEPGKGTGLGLSISHTIIGKHKGSLRVYNEGGAVFAITLPLAESQELPLAA